MIKAQEAGYEPPYPSAPTLLLAVCAALGIGTFATAHLFVLSQPFSVVDGEDVSEYTKFGVLVLALLVWRLFPRWSWPVLLGLGALCAVPPNIYLLTHIAEPWMRIPYLVIDAASRPLLLVGLLATITVVWRAGHHVAATAMLGVPLVLPPLIAFVVFTFSGEHGVEYIDLVPVSGLALAIGTIVATIAAVVTRVVAPAPRPGWPVTIGGAVAGAAPVLFPLWRGPAWEMGADAATIDAYYAELGQHNLIVGLVVLGVSLAAGLVAGPRVLLTGTVAGLLVGAVATLLTPAIAIIRDLSAASASLLALAMLAVGVALTLARARVIIGVVGLGAAVVWLAVLWLVSRPVDEPFDPITMGLVLVLVVVAAMPVLASLGTAVGPAVPAAFAGVAAGVSAGALGIGSYLKLTGDDGHEAYRLASYLPAIVLLVVATGLTVLATRLWRRTEARRADLEPVTVG